MQFSEAIDWWYQRVDFEKRPAGRDELKLDRMRALLARIGNPQDRLKIIHVAGSKGKGSTSAMFESVGRAAGLRTGLFTSPHLCDVRERIQVNGQPISEMALRQRLTEMRPMVDGMADPPTFFEIATALAFHHFAAVGVQLAVIEVGMGGRFDSTNVCTPVLSVIASISHDHTAILGDTLKQIAFEKCGIIKHGIPVVSGVVAEAAEVVQKTCVDRQAALLQLERDFTCEHIAGHVDGSGHIRAGQVKYKDVSSRKRQRPGLPFQVPDAPGSLFFDVNLLGAHQAANASLVVAGSHVLGIDDNAIRIGLAKVLWPARMEVFAGPPLTILDCAHNVASARTVVETLNESFSPIPRALLFACSADKDVPGILQTLLPSFDEAIFCRFANNPRAMSPDRLMELAKTIRPDLAMSESNTASCGLQRLTSAVEQPRIVVITGSVFLAGELRPLLMEKLN